MDRLTLYDKLMDDNIMSLGFRFSLNPNSRSMLSPTNEDEFQGKPRTLLTLLEPKTNGWVTDVYIYFDLGTCPGGTRIQPPGRQTTNGSGTTQSDKSSTSDKNANVTNASSTSDNQAAKALNKQRCDEEQKTKELYWDTLLSPGQCHFDAHHQINRTKWYGVNFVCICDDYTEYVLHGMRDKKCDPCVDLEIYHKAVLKHLSQKGCESKGLD